MPRRLVSVLAALAIGGVLAGCGEDKSTAPTTPPATTAPPATQPPPTTQPPAPPPTTVTPAPQQDKVGRFVKRDLARVALKPSDAPKGMVYSAEESGPRTLEQIGIIVDSQLAQIRAYRFVGAFDAIFDSKVRSQADLRLGARMWLFKTTGGASRWFAKTRQDAELNQLTPSSIPMLGDESWSGRGTIPGTAAVISHAFRVSNLVVVVSYTAARTPLSAPAALAVAKTALARVTAK